MCYRSPRPTLLRAKSAKSAYYSIAPHAILQARGAEVKGGTIFCSMMPCPECMKLAGANQIKQIVYREERPNAAEARKCEGIAAYYDIRLVRNEELTV